MNNNNEILNGAVVLGGGGSLAIGWELGYLYALENEGIDIRNADLVIGTSGGAQAATGITSTKSWEEIFNEQIEPKSNEEPPQQNMEAVEAKYSEIAQKSHSPEEWIENYSEFALQKNKFDESEHINRLKHRIKVTSWPQNLMITAIDAQASKRAVFTKDSNVDIYRPMASSGSLPGVWPATTIDGKKYYDGGCHSMENADLAKGAHKVLILATNLPIVTPYKINDAIAELQNSGANVKLITPSEDVLQKLNELGGNTVDTAIRPEMARLGQQQGERDAQMIKEFWS
ncbi:patatin-like phospholipase family protein [Staphylococcus lloydii]|uniref:patatin-like phospholipase family protein n=1 Tax=Staphylococcus lloydii TaxID=2781774 RepID=UPI00292994E3|nr:patatin-like phospholipase family protein [Staphylococcus lloydii]MDU9418704.1 patatin-like phospholipase family protein [Staphylococcus lloydii]